MRSILTWAAHALHSLFPGLSIFAPSSSTKADDKEAASGESARLPSGLVVDGAGRQLDLVAIDRSMTFLPSSRVTISCGTVTLDPHAGKVLLVWNRHLGILQLPMGRRHVAKGYLAAALRETEEETGVRPQALPLRVATRATLPAGTARRRTADPDVVDDREITEFVAAHRYPDPQSAGRPADKTVYFFAGVADSAAPPARGAQEEWEKLDARWTDVQEALETLAFGAERCVLKKVLADARRTGVLVKGA